MSMHFLFSKFTQDRAIKNAGFRKNNFVWLVDLLIVYLLREGSLWLHMILIGRPFSTSKFIVSKARSAKNKH